MEGIDQSILISHLQVFAFFTFLYLIFNWIAARWGFYRLPEDAEIIPSGSFVVTFLKVLGAFAVFLGANVLMAAVIRFYFSIRDGYPFLTELPIEDKFSSFAIGWIDLIFILVSFITLMLYTAFLGKPTWRALTGINFSPPNHRFVHDILVGISIIAVCYPLLNMVHQITGLYFDLNGVPSVEQVPVEKIRLIKGDNLLFVFTGINVVILVPILEELLFRGYFQTWAVGTLGRFFGVLMTALIFASFHYADKQGIRNIQIIGTLFVLSLFLGYLKERQQSLWAPIGLHVAFNSIALTALLIERFS